MAKKKKSPKEENSLRTFQDLHSAVANLAAHYIPRNEITEYFTPEELQGIQKKPSYSVTPDERGLVERVIFRLVEKKDKIIGEGDEQRTVEANASESVLQAVGTDIPRILREAEDLAGIDPSNINPDNIEPFLRHTKDTILAYLAKNEKKLIRYGSEDAFVSAVTGISKIDEHVETQVRHACKKKIHVLETEVRAAQDAEADIRADQKEFAGEKEVLSQAVVALEAAKEAQVAENIRLNAKQAGIETRSAKVKSANEQLRLKNTELEADQVEFGHAWGNVAHSNERLRERAANLAENVTVLAKDKRGLKSDLAQTIQYKEAEVKELQERVMNAEQDKEARAEEVKDLQARAMYAEHNLEKQEAIVQEVEDLYVQLADANDDIFELSEKSARLEAEKDEETENREQLEEEFEALHQKYVSRFTELGNSVAEWYAFAETAIRCDELSGNEQVQGLRAKNTELAGLVTDLIEEAKSGARFKGKKQVPVSWKPGEEASLPTQESSAPEDVDSKYQELESKYDNANAEHNRQMWALMHRIQDMPDSAYTPEQKKETYEFFLAAKPQDVSIQGIVHCHIGKILYDNAQDYSNARAEFVKAVELGKQELQERPKDKEAKSRLAQYQNNIVECNKKLAA